MPVGGDALVFPGLGTLRLPAGTGTVRLRPGRNRVQPEAGEWEAVPRIRVESEGLTLDIVLEADDPHLARYGAPPQRPDQEELDRWRALLNEAWHIVVATDPLLAADLSADLQVIVPLGRAPGQSPLSATSGWAPGAVGLSLPADAVSLAETLVHEYRHCVLGVVEDIMPLVDLDSDALYYAPWRDDPRPPGGLLHGCFAHLAVTAFWRQQRKICTAELEPWAQHQFARWRHATATAVTELLGSSALTKAGRCLADAMHDALERWQHEPVPEDALKEASAVNTEHWLRWRLANLHPDEEAICALVEDWRAGVAPRESPVPTWLVSGRRRPAGRRSLTSEDLRPAAPTSADQRTWIEMALAARPIIEPIEVAYAVFSRLRLLDVPPTPGAVLAWVATGTFAVVQKRS